jgi:phosphoenolpyruvate synthase/pyruvate phosphate dikinase
MPSFSAALPSSRKEENPMIGLRGASRYYSDIYRDGFALECQAIKMLREQMGFDNVLVMIPFCRSPEEADKVLDVMAKNGLESAARTALQVYVMCEIPSNVIWRTSSPNGFDGFSIGSNDLTQLTLGVDRDNGQLSGVFSESRTGGEMDDRNGDRPRPSRLAPKSAFAVRRRAMTRPLPSSWSRLASTASR